MPAGYSSQLRLQLGGGPLVGYGFNAFDPRTDPRTGLNDGRPVLTPGGDPIRYAGTGECGISGDGGPATEAKISPRGGIFIDAAGSLYLTESGGVWDAERRLLPLIKVGDIRGLIQKGIVRDGMIPKLRSCARTLRHVVGEIDILPSDSSGVLIEAVENRAATGTRIVQGSEPTEQLGQLVSVELAWIRAIHRRGRGCQYVQASWARGQLLL